MDSFRNGYIFGFVTAIACVLAAMLWTLPSQDISEFVNQQEVSE